jgi:hypothetical protein
MGILQKRAARFWMKYRFFSAPAGGFGARFQLRLTNAQRGTFL